MCALRQARILSSETDNTIKQEQTTNVNIKVQQPQTPVQPKADVPSGGISYSPSYVGHNISPNFTIPPMTEGSAYPSVAPIGSPFPSDASSTERGIPHSSSFEVEIEHLTLRNKFLELLLEMYQNNPLKINSYIICNNKLFMDMIKLLTGAEKVDLILNDDISCDCSGCCANADNDELIYVSKILVTKEGETKELKYCYNDVYSQFIKYGISTKIVCR